MSSTYLGKGNSSVFVSVHFLNDLSGFLLANVEATGLDKALELLAGDAARAGHVKGVAGLGDVEERHAVEVCLLKE